MIFERKIFLCQVAEYDDDTCGDDFCNRGINVELLQEQADKAVIQHDTKHTQNEIQEKLYSSVEAGTREHDRHARPGGQHGIGVLQAGAGVGLRGRAGVPADGCELSELAGPVHHHHGFARRVRGNCVVTVLVAHNVQRARIDGGNHVDRRGHGKQHPAGDICQ